MTEIRQLAGDEMILVHEIAHETWPNTFQNILSKDQITFMLDWMYNLETLQRQVAEGHLFYAFFENNKPLGFIGLEPFYPNETQIKIHKIYILPNTQGKGIGKLLIQKSIAIAEELGLKNIVLNVNRFNNAVSFYQKIGFTIVCEEDIDIGNGYLMEDFVMNYEL